jgi:Fe2+ or Zn2+ uptake regulation protein
MSPAEVMLVGKGVKPTPQRVVITEYLMGAESHPTADQILEAVSEKLPVALSRATVYNTLKTLVDAGVIQEVLTEPGRARYDANVSEHHHFVDVKTGKIMDVPHEAVPQLRNQLGSKFKVHNYTVTFFGDLAEDK